MSKLLQEQIDQLRHEVGFLARHLRTQEVMVQQLLARLGAAAGRTGVAVDTCGTVIAAGQASANGKASAGRGRQQKPPANHPSTRSRG